MKAFTKLMCLLLLVAMCLSLMAAPAYASGQDVGRITAEMMGEDPGYEPDPEPAASGDTTVKAAEGTAQTSNTPVQKVVRAVVQKADGSEVSYETLNSALSNAVAGEVVVVKADASFGSTLYLDKRITVVNYGHTLTVSVPATSLGISGTGATIRGGSVVINASPVQVAEGQPQPTYQAGISGVTLDDVNVYYGGPASMLGGNVTVYAGSYSSDPGAHVAPGYKSVLGSDGRYKLEKAPDPTPAVTEIPEVTENPEATETPEVTENPEATETPEVTEIPEATETPEVTENPEATEIPEVTEIPEATATPAPTTVIDQITEFLFGQTGDGEDVDEAAKTIEHNSDKVDSAGNTLVTVSGAPDDVTLEVANLGLPSELEELISEQVEGEVTIVKALDINVSGELEEAVEVTLQSSSFVGLSDKPTLWHMVGDTPVPVTITDFDPDTGTIKFVASSFSPYVVTIPNKMDWGTEDSEVAVELAPDSHVKGDGMAKAVTSATTSKYTVILDADSVWNVTSWGSVSNLEVNLNGHRLNTLVVVPAGKSLTITGKGGDSEFDSAKVMGTLVLAGSGRGNGNVTLEGGTLYIDGGNFPIAGTIAANGSSYVEISRGSYGPITASGSAGGYITGGTFKTNVPSNLLANGYSSIKKADNKFDVEMTVEATVKTLSGIPFSRHGGNYVEFYKGDANASQNYSFQFAVTKKDDLSSLEITAPDGSTISMSAGTDYTYDSATGRVVISKNSLTNLLGSVPAGRAYIKFTFKNGSVIEVPLNIYPSVTFEPTTYIIDSFEPVVFTLTDTNFSYITVDLKDGENAYYKQLASSNYTISGNKLTLSSSYLNLITPGSHNFDFWYDMGFGKTIRLRCTVLVYKDYKIVEINNVNMYKDKNMADVNWYQYSGKNLNFTANGDASKFTGVKVDGKLIAAGNYMVTKDTANGTTNVGLYPGYLATLAQGKHTIAVVFTDGEATATFTSRPATL